MKIIRWVIIVVVIAGVAFIVLKLSKKTDIANQNTTNPNSQSFPLAVNYMRGQSYPGSNITIEHQLADGNGFHQYITSYQSDGLKIYALLTIPVGSKPAGGWPVILFNHGYIPPEQYRTNERYIVYVAGFASHGYIVFKPDYRGNGLSQGQPGSAYFSPSYTIDDLNALASIKKYPEANPNKIGVWGHSLGGNLTLRDLVTSPDIKAAVIWGGVVGSYNDIVNNWQNKVSYHPAPEDLTLRNQNRQTLINQYGNPQSNSAFWQAIDPTNFIQNITAPVQLDVGGADTEVPLAFSLSLYQKLQAAGKTAEYYVYLGSDHNISQGFNLAMQRSLAFFDRYLK